MLLGIVTPSQSVEGDGYVAQHCNPQKKNFENLTFFAKTIKNDYYCFETLKMTKDIPPQCFFIFRRFYAPPFFPGTAKPESNGYIRRALYLPPMDEQPEKK